ncbi:13006_t:CDS:2 [Rhizophagus irregularis]|nr:13006_t:CDS:2 [Rhizophagus irregularis]
MSNIKIQSIAIIGKQNNPLYIKNFSLSHPDLKYHYIAHTSCDVIEERVGAVGSEAADTYLGLLYAMEDLDVVKFVVVLSVTDAIKNTDMKNVYGKRSIVSKRFVAAIDAIGNMPSDGDDYDSS